jgi:DNA/RNA-binding domain of Phe-tRNA-synthetase-like protein
MEAATMSEPPAEAELCTGWIADEVAEEFPALRLRWLQIAATPGRSSPGVQQRLAQLSDRFRGMQAVAMRRQPIPWAYRVFYRHVGLDPDAVRTPIEQAAVQRLLHGAFRSRNRVDDALLIGLVETGVPVWALDADAVDGSLGIRSAAAGECLGRGREAQPLAAGRLVVADHRSPMAMLFGAPAAEHRVTPHTTRMRLYSLQVQGVPDIHVEEALYSCVALLGER